MPGSVAVRPVVLPPILGLIDWCDPVMPLPDAPPGGLTVVWASAADAIEAAMSDAVMQ
ncbi:hypothetical protein [Rhizobium sp. BG4]|uniref:hypothetical protein n=1 Tax=Rhizobium sp. BG4 TaxID=2613770 RepID=UPI00193DB650|nr:hypothetical protein [Rhizobium sp. BG4]